MRPTITRSPTDGRQLRPGGSQTPDEFLPPLGAAYRAYYEHLPFRRASMPIGPHMQQYRRFELGDLIELAMLDPAPPELDAPDQPTVATEFVGTSISSGKGNDANFAAAMADNPRARFYNGHQRGLPGCDVSRSLWRTETAFVDDARVRTSPVRTSGSWVVESDRPGVIVG